ncbi:PREDICTED: uncharacterized protein LOC106100941 [Papilio polytes]|uniref:uncharacterized protein LOC106100941 n=1 Tax=Papilio polytes TaxID=76194 RepID=UPI00067637B2|nr:PREDICTED: uncharacterized protein LOC106100941 [Papilio polytes]
MAQTMEQSKLHLCILLIVWLVSGGDGYSCPYGQQCGFEPAPPGRNPPCAQPGLTYCLHPEPYPEHVIHKLIEAGQYDIRTLLTDESRDEFDAKKKGSYPYSYGPNSLPHVDHISLVHDPLTTTHHHKDVHKYHGRFTPDIFSDKTSLQPPSSVDPSPYNVYLPANNTKLGFNDYVSGGNYWNRNRQYDYTKKGLRHHTLIPHSPGYNHGFLNEPNLYPGYDVEWFRQPDSDSVTQYNPTEWWKYMTPSRSDGVTIQRSISFPAHTTTVRRRRNAELVQAASKRKLTGAEALRIALGLANEDSSAERPRRQAQDNTQELCRVRTQFITPRAALNNKGNWRYVVNMADNMTQLVRAEICASTECNGLCTIPLGYSSRCEQKYIQKRLVALETSGQTLYTDLFWIPSCCQCTIVNNN